MSAFNPFLTLDQAWDDALSWVCRQLNGAGLHVEQTFDLQVARQAHDDCPCPHHGTSQCNCQIIVLLTYRDAEKPLTLMLHGHDGTTWIALEGLPGHRADPSLEVLVRHLLHPNTTEAVPAGRMNYGSDTAA